MQPTSPKAVPDATPAPADIGLQQPVSDLVDVVGRLTRACAYSAAVAATGSAQVVADLLTEVAGVVSKPIDREASGKPVTPMPASALVDSLSRALQGAVDSMTRAQKEFGDAYRRPSEPGPAAADSSKPGT